MSNEFTIESLEEEIEREYAPLKFRAGGEEFVLRSLMRIGKKDREQVMEKLSSLDAEEGTEDELNEDDTISAVHFVLRKVCADGRGDRLVEAIGEDLLLNSKLMEKWTEATQPGEAQDSPT